MSRQASSRRLKPPAGPPASGADGRPTPKKFADACEVDHLISLEIGGADDPRNLWPRPYDGASLNARVKDRLESRLHAEVCAGNVALEDAQREIAADWVQAFRKYIGEPPR